MENLVHIGHVSRVHGYKGQVKIVLNPNTSIKKPKGLVLFVEFANKPVPFFFTSFQEQPDQLVIHFEGIDSEEKASELIGRQVHAESKFVIVEVDDLQKLNGYAVIDQDDKPVGTVSEIVNYNQYLVKVMIDGNEVLLPMNEETLLGIDDANKILHLHIPEGLLDFYKNN